MKHIVIVGGGFAGVTTAVDLAKRNLHDVRITVVTPRSYFDYYPGLFHLLTGFSVKQLAIPYDYIFEGTGIIHEKAEVTSIDVEKRIVCTGVDCMLQYDYLVIAPGSVTNYFEMEEFKEYLHTVSTVDDTLELRRSIHEMLTRCHFDPSHPKCTSEIIIIGGGPNGTESAAEVAAFVRQVATAYQLEPNQIKVTLYVSGDRVTPNFDAKVSQYLSKKLTDFGVNIVYNKRVSKDEMATVLVPAIKANQKLVVWSTGMKLAPLAGTLTQLKKDTKGKVIVDPYMRATKIDGTVSPSVFVGGDLACTQYSGLAQTAHYDGHDIAANIAASVTGAPLQKHTPKNKGYVVAMGREWAIFVKGSLHLTGRVIWYLRRLIDLKSYLQIVSIRKSLELWMSEHETWEEFDASARRHIEEKYTS
ncbi:MAG: FAD-dependent oxidoreductase [bacterium]